MSRRDERRARRAARKASRRGRRSERKEARGGSSFQRKTARKLARAEKKQTRRDSRRAARQLRVDARKAKGIAKIAAKGESGYWSPEGIAARQETLGGLIETGGDVLGGLLGGGAGDESSVAWDEAGYSEAAAFEGAYPDEYADEMGELIDLPPPDEEMDIPWAWVAAAGGLGLVGIYMFTQRSTTKGMKRKTARRAYVR
jgi:hypothetical protein